MTEAFNNVDSYKGYEIGYDNDGTLFVSKNITDRRYSRIEVVSTQEAIEYIDQLVDNK